jgi:hypothetical protein
MLVGTFVGSVVDGVPDGSGEFTVEMGRHKGYRYSGEWREGKYDGQGEEVDVFDGVEHGSYEGYFDNGVIKYGGYLHPDGIRTFEGTFNGWSPHRGVIRDTDRAIYLFVGTQAGVWEERFWKEKKGWILPVRGGVWDGWMIN